MIPMMCYVHVKEFLTVLEVMALSIKLDSISVHNFVYLRCKHERGSYVRRFHCDNLRHLALSILGRDYSPIQN